MVTYVVLSFTLHGIHHLVTSLTKVGGTYFFAFILILVFFFLFSLYLYLLNYIRTLHGPCREQTAGTVLYLSDHL